MNKYAAVLLASLLVLGCSRQDGVQLDDNRAVQIFSSVSDTKLSKGLANPTTALSSVRFLRLDGTTAPASMSGAAFFLGDRAANGNITWSGVKPLYLLNNTNAYFVAYHPSSGSGVIETANSNVEWTIDGKSDLLLSGVWDSGKYTSPITGSAEGQTALTFEHLLSRLEVVFRAQADVTLAHLRRQYGKITGVKLTGSQPKATYSYVNNNVIFSGTRSDISLVNPDFATDFAAIDIPSSSNAAVNAAGLFAPTTGALTLSISTEKYSSIPLTVRLNSGGSDKDFVAGYKHTVTIGFNADKGAVEVIACSIVDWSAKYTTDSDVVI